MTPTALAGMTAVSHDAVQKGRVKPLGYITWFSVPDESVSIPKLRKVWQLAGLDPTPLPKDQKAIWVFKRAMREQEGRIRHDGTIVETEVADVVETPDEAVYQISRVVRDVDERIVNYPKAMRVIFNKHSDDIAYKVLGEVPRSEMLPMMETIQDYFDSHAKTVTGAKVRQLVRNYIKHDTDEQSNMVGLSGENLRGKAGAIYFVLAKHRDQLESLAECLDELYADHRAYLFTVPLADGASERELIRRHHVANSVQEAKDAMAEAAALIREERSRGVRSNVAAHHWNRLQRLQRRTAAYQDALREESEEIQEISHMLHRQLRKLV